MLINLHSRLQLTASSESYTFSTLKCYSYMQKLELVVS